MANPSIEPGRIGHPSYHKQETRGRGTVREIQSGNSKEKVVERSDFPPERIRDILANETVAVLGYGVQGRGQSLNLKDNQVRVIVGLRDKGRGWDLALKDGWVPGQTLF